MKAHSVDALQESYKLTVGFFWAAAEKARLYAGQGDSAEGARELNTSDELWDQGQDHLLDYVHQALGHEDLVEAFSGNTPVETDATDGLDMADWGARRERALRLNVTLLAAVLQLRDDHRHDRPLRTSAMHQLNEAYCGLLELLS